MIQLASSSGMLRLALILLLFATLCWLSWWIMIRMPLESHADEWTPLSAAEIAIRDRLKEDVRVLAEEIGERHLYHYANLMQAVEFLESALGETGRVVSRQPFTAQGRECVNLSIEIPGVERPDEIVVIGAHYDSAQGSPAANDNGSGVAALLAIARAFAGETPQRTLRLVAFANEEPPFFLTADMGSHVYAREAARRGENIVAMVSIETIGYYSEEEGSQRYPFPFRLFYPSKGNFIAFVGNVPSRHLVRKTLTAFRQSTPFPSEGAALPSFIPGVGWSDHWSFWQEGYPAIMVTDTAPFRYPYYHTAEDTYEKLDYDRMARVVSGLKQVVKQLVYPE